MAKDIDFSQIHFELIAEKFYSQYRVFNCGNSSMDNFLKHSAYFSTISKEAATSLVFYNDKLVGYFTLQRHETRKFEELDQMSFLYIERIAVSKEYQRIGFGEYILNEILKIARMTNERLIFLDALIEKLKWYETRHFIKAIEEEAILSNEDGLVNVCRLT